MTRPLNGAWVALPASETRACHPCLRLMAQVPVPRAAWLRHEHGIPVLYCGPCREVA